MRRPGSRTVVTGGAGFIGSHLVEHLLHRGDEVVVLDDLSTGSVHNLADVAAHPRLRWVEGSATDPQAVRRATRGADRIVHLAAAAGVVRGTEVVLDAALESGSEILLAPTGDVRGTTADRLDEAYARACWSGHGLPVTIVRLFTTCGPRQPGRRGPVLPRFVGQALRGEPLMVHGDGRQTRCFASVGDVVPAMVDLLESKQSTGQAFDLGGDHETSVIELARLVLDVTDSDSPIVLVPHEEIGSAGHEDVRHRLPDNRRAHALIGYAPHTPVDEMIRHVADCFAGIDVHALRAPVQLLETRAR